MRLIDRARPAHDGRDAGRLVMPGFGPERHRRRCGCGRRAAWRGPPPPSRASGARPGTETSSAVSIRPKCAEAVEARAARRPARTARGGSGSRPGRGSGRPAELPVEGAGLGQDVAGVAALRSCRHARSCRADRSARSGSPRSIISSAMRLSSQTSSAAAITALAPRAGFEECASKPCTVVWNVTTLLCASTTASSVGSPTMTASRHRQVAPEAADRVDDAEAGRLLVVGQHDVDRRLQARRLELGHERERERVEALHVDGAAPEDAPVLDPQAERVRGPGLARHRHHVRVARQHDAAAVLRTDRGEERRLVAGRVRDPDEGHVPARQIVLDEVDRAAGWTARSRCRRTRASSSISSGVSRWPCARMAVLSERRASRAGCRGRRRGSRPRRSRPPAVTMP